jgi:PAS domain S-box-containing protein
MAAPALAKTWGPEELAATLDSVATAIWAVDLEGRCVFVNQAACRIFGYSREECLGRRLQCLVHRRNPEGWNCPKEECPIQQALERCSPAKLDDEVFLHRDGTRLPVQCSIQPVGKHGRILGAVISVADLAPLKRAEDSLRKSHEWLGFAQRAAGVGIFDADLKTGETRVSEGQFLIYGLDPAGKWPSHEEWLKLVHPEDRDRIDRELESAQSGAQFPRTEFRIVWPDGSIHWLLSQLKVFFDEGGTAARQVGVNVDVTGRVYAETVLNQFFSASPTPMAIWGFDGRIQRVNPAWEPMLGFTAADVEGMQIFDRLHPEDRALAAGEFKKLLASERRAGFECRAGCKDGSYRWLLLDAAVQKDAQLIYVTAHDITKGKAAEEALRSSEALFRSAFDNTLFGMAIVGLDGRYLRVSQSLCRITGFSEQELQQTNFSAITYPDDVSEGLGFRHALMEGVKSGGITTKRYVRKNGELVWVSVHVTLVRDALGKPLHFVTLVEDLTERKRAEKEARTSEEWLQFTLNAAGIGLCHRESGETTASEQQFRLYGIEPARTWLSRERWLELVHPGDRERVEIEQRLAMERGRPYDIQFRVVWPDGSVRWLLCRGKVFHEDGKIEVTVDVTELKRAETALEEFFSLCPSPISIFGFDGFFKRVNAAVPRISGFAAEEFTCRRGLEFFHPDDRPMMEEEFRKLITRGGDSEFECRGLRKDGSFVWLLFSATAVPDERLIFTVAHDITERKRMTEALRAEEYTLSESQRIAHVGSWKWDVPVGTGVCAWTPETYRVFGVSQDTFVPTVEAFQSLIHADDRAAMGAWISACLAGEEPPDLEFRVGLPDGGVRYILGRGHLERDAENKPIRMIGIAQDITERRCMTDALKLNVEKLARSNEELERFAYVASHDLQEPLRMVASFTQLLAKRYSGRLDETADRYINYAVDGAKRMQQLIADLLAYSRVNNKEIDLRQIDCAAVVLDAMRNLEVAIKESGAAIDWDPLPALWADQEQLTLLFQNLLANAIKFRRKDECPRIHVSAVDSGAEWTISVRDNGIGIDARHAERVFQIFQRLHTRQEYPGTGIGLAVCKKVVERHGGKLWVESEPGAGSTFRFTIPKPKINGTGDQSANQTGRDSVD